MRSIYYSEDDSLFAFWGAAQNNGMTPTQTTQTVELRERLKKKAPRMVCDVSRDGPVLTIRFMEQAEKGAGRLFDFEDRMFDCGCPHVAAMYEEKALNKRHPMFY